MISMHSLYIKNYACINFANLRLAISNSHTISVLVKAEQQIEKVPIWLVGDTERRFFRVLEGIEVSTAFPLVLFLYQTISDKADLFKALEILESYLVRRNICKLTTKNYNKLFVQIINELKKFYAQDEEISPYIEQLKIDGEDKFSIIRDVHDVEIGGKKLITILANDLIKLLYK